MNVKRFFLAVIMAGVAAVQMPVVNAQTEQRARRADIGWAAIATSSQTASAVRQFEPDRDMPDRNGCSNRVSRGGFEKEDCRHLGNDCVASRRTPIRFAANLQ